VVEVTSDAAGASGVVKAQVDIAAPPAVVWAVIVDPANTGRLMAGAKSCRVLQRDPGGRWDVRETISRSGLFPAVRTVLHADYQPYSDIRFHRIDGDLPVLDGEWRLEPLDGGARTRVFYESRVTPSFPAPAPLVRSVLRQDMPRTLANLRDASEAVAAATARP
jgi:uncharacterized protein YndB with AHSA1/START domain